MSVAVARPLFEERVTRTARAFELKPLLDLLRKYGYRRDQLLFESNREGGATAIVQAIEFRRSGGTTSVLITVNLGLLGDNALLPSYFMREVEKTHDPQPFYDFVRFFDHQLIQNYLRATWPEDDATVYGDFGLVHRAVLNLAGCGSVSSLHWFTQLVFPELRVRVTRDTFAAATSSHACRAGISVLDGSSVIGRVYETESQGFLVELITEDEQYDAEHTWAGVIRKRLLERYLPVLAPFRPSVLVVLVVLSHASWARIETAPDEATGYLGYDRIRGKPDTRHRVVLFSGVAGEADTD